MATLDERIKEVKEEIEDVKAKITRIEALPEGNPERQRLIELDREKNLLRETENLLLRGGFGHETMPVFNLVRNCLYYWGFAAFVSYFNNHPRYTAPPLVQTQAALALALLCQLANWRCHVILANLRKPGEKGYKIPRGFLFNFITCANYTAEIWGWTCFSVAVQALPAAIFTLVGAAQMTQWALQKHARLRKTFDGKEGREKYPRRWIVLPPLL
ncbi:3-oxo-5-alpha-steroid 4-dehydrogenase-domain-containing protein [Haematococcus lacustris]